MLTLARIPCFNRENTVSGRGLKLPHIFHGHNTSDGCVLLCQDHPPPSRWRPFRCHSMAAAGRAPVTSQVKVTVAPRSTSTTPDVMTSSTNARRRTDWGFTGDRTCHNNQHYVAIWSGSRQPGQATTHFLYSPRIKNDQAWVGILDLRTTKSTSASSRQYSPRSAEILPRTWARYASYTSYHWLRSKSGHKRKVAFVSCDNV